MNSNWERWGRAAGAAFVVLTIAAFVVGGEPPSVGDPASDVVSYYGGDRSQILVSSVLFVLGLGFFLWFAATLANNFRERGEGRVGVTVIGAATAFVTVQVVVTGLNAVTAYSVAAIDDGAIAKAFFDLQWTLDVLAAVPSLVFFLAVGMGFLRTAMAPRWLAIAAVLIAVLFALRTTNWASDGFWSPTGEYLFVLIPLVSLWILVTSIVLVRSSAQAAAAQPASP
jgi:hypothetical protein